MIKVGITQWTAPWKEEEKFQKASEMGMSVFHMELGSADKGYPMTDPVKQAFYLQEAEKYGIEMISLALNDLCGHGFTGGFQTKDGERAKRTIELGIRTCAEMKIPTISVPHFFANAIVDDESYRHSVEAVKYLCDLAAEQGVQILSENIMTVSELERFFNDVNKDNLKLMYDTRNYSGMGSKADAIEVFNAFYDRLGNYVHLKDGDTDLGNCSLGTGNSHFMEILDVIRKSGYEGARILESDYTDLLILQKDVDLAKL